MNISKILIGFIIIIQFFLINSISYGEDVGTDVGTDIGENVKKEEAVNLDEEELPAIDPFQSSSAGTSGASPEAIPTPDEGILSGLKLVGVIIGKNKKIAVLSSKEGFALKFEENQKINKDIELQEIYTDHLLIKDSQEKFYEVYMNDIIRSVEG